MMIKAKHAILYTVYRPDLQYFKADYKTTKKRWTQITGNMLPVVCRSSLALHLYLVEAARTVLHGLNFFLLRREGMWLKKAELF